MSPIPWFKVDDALATHDKVLAAGNAAMGLWVRAGAWSAQHLTDGHIPNVTVKLLGNHAQARALVNCGLWLEDTDGYQFHEWNDYQPTREHVEKVREARRQTGKLGGKASGEKRSKPEANPKQVASTLSNPRPVPTRPITGDLSSQSSLAGAKLDDDGLTRISKALNNAPKTHAKKTAEFVLAKAPTDVRNPVAYILAAIADNPDAYRYRRGNPKRDQECPTHAGEWADACRGCAIDQKVTA